VTSPDAPTPWQTQAPTASSPLLPAGLVFSDMPSRLMALILDGFVLGPAYYILYALLGVDFSRLGVGDFPDRNVYVFATLGILVLNAVYFVWFWSGGRRATPGQRVFSIQVANAFDGMPLSVGQAFGRWAATGWWITTPFVLPFIGVAIASGVVAIVWDLVLLLSTIISPVKQGLHDRFAGSAVVRPAGAGNRWAVAFLAVLLILTLLEGALLWWAFYGEPARYMPQNYLDRYLHWMWPY
jgi:uncharacterized RDD family membrane protein YckC